MLEVWKKRGLVVAVIELSIWFEFFWLGLVEHCPGFMAQFYQEYKQLSSKDFEEKVGSKNKCSSAIAGYFQWLIPWRAANRCGTNKEVFAPCAISYSSLEDKTA